MGRKASLTKQGTLANTYVQLQKFNPVTKQNEPLGTFIFAIQMIPAGAQLTVYQQGSAPILNFIVTKSIHWNYQNLVYCYFLDPLRNQYLAVFNDSKTAAMVTATIVCITRKIKNEELIHHDLVKTEGKGINFGDTLQISYFLFPLDVSVVGQCCFSIEQKKVKFQKDSMIVGIAQSIVGMTTGSTRIIVIPSGMTGYENGTRDEKIQAVNHLAVVLLHRAKFGDEAAHHSGTDQSDAEPVPVQPSEPPPPSEKSDTDKDESDFTSVDEAKLETLRKIQKIGGKTTMRPPGLPTGMPISTPLSTQTVIAHQQKATEEQLKKLEENISKQIDAITEDPKTADIITGVITLSQQLLAKQNEIAQLKSDYENVTKNSGVATQRQVEFAQSEAADMRKKSAQAERKLKDAEQRLAELKKASQEEENDDDVDYEKIAKDNTKAIIKKMMGGVFDDISDFIDPDESYSGEDISDKLFNLLRKHSLPLLDTIKQNGVL